MEPRAPPSVGVAASAATPRWPSPSCGVVAVVSGVIETGERLVVAAVVVAAVGLVAVPPGRTALATAGSGTDAAAAAAGEPEGEGRARGRALVRG